MILRSLLLFVLTIVPFYAFSQVGIGITTPSPSSILDISSSDKGVLLPRVDLGGLNTASPISNPEKSLVLWNTDAANGGLQQGFYYWSGSVWSPIGGEARPKLFADKYNANDVVISASQPISFDVQSAGEGINTTNGNYYVIPKDGYYRISFSLSIEKYNGGGGSTGVYMFYLSKTANPSGKINGTSIRTEIPNQFSISSVFGSKIVYLEENDNLYLISQRAVRILSESSYNIEFVND